MMDFIGRHLNHTYLQGRNWISGANIRAVDSILGNVPTVHCLRLFVCVCVCMCGRKKSVTEKSSAKSPAKVAEAANKKREPNGGRSHTIIVKFIDTSVPSINRSGRFGSAFLHHHHPHPAPMSGCAHSVWFLIRHWERSSVRVFKSD